MIYVKRFLRHLHAEGGAGCQAGQAGFVTWLYLCVNVAIFPPRSPGRVRWAGKAWRCCHLVPTFSRWAPAGTRGGPLLLPLTNLRFACLSHEVGGGLLGPVGGCGQAPGRGPAASTAFDFHMNVKASVYITIPMPVFGGILTKWDERRRGAVGTPSPGSFVTSCLCGPFLHLHPGWTRPVSCGVWLRSTSNASGSQESVPRRDE